MSFDGLTVISLVVGFGLLIVAGARLGAGSHSSLAGLFATHGGRDWPIGVQEGDAPRFLLPSRSDRSSGRAADSPPPETPPPVIEDLYAGPIRSIR
jgi:hypothetical protein